MWPPTLARLKLDLGIDDTDTSRDELLEVELAAAAAFVQRSDQRGGEFNFDGDTLSELPDPTEDVVLGTVRLAGRWHTRRRSPDGLIDMGELGASRVPSIDPDIERLLGVGRYREPMV